MKCSQRNSVRALSATLAHTPQHLARRFFREGQSKNVFAQQGIVPFKQVPDSLRNHPSFPGPRPRNHQQRPLAVLNRAPLRRIHLQSKRSRRRPRPIFKKIKQRSHSSASLPFLEANRKRSTSVKELNSERRLSLRLCAAPLDGQLHSGFRLLPACARESEGADAKAFRFVE